MRISQQLLHFSWDLLEALIEKERLKFCFCKQRLGSREGENWIFALTHTASLGFFDAYTEGTLQSLWYLQGYWRRAHLSFLQCMMDCKQIPQYILLWFSNSRIPWNLLILTGLSYQQVAVSFHSVWLLIGAYIGISLYSQQKGTEYCSFTWTCKAMWCT